jgi:hypothetical protein
MSGVPTAPVVAFPEEPRVSRVDERDAWLTTSDVAMTRQRIDSFLQSHGFRFGTWHGFRFGTWDCNTLTFEGGSRWKTRLLGGRSGPDSRLPSSGRIRIQERGPSVLVEAAFRESWSQGVISALKGRYETVFQARLRDLRRATGGRTP